jgi:hypothetical protein
MGPGTALHSRWGRWDGAQRGAMAAVQQAWLLGRASLWPLERRAGVQISPPTAVTTNQTAVVLRIRPDLTSIPGGAVVGLSGLIEQSPDGGTTWYVLGGFTTPDITHSLHTKGVFTGELIAAFTEQVYREDILATQPLWASRRSIPTDTALLYHQLTVCPHLRVTLDTYTPDGSGARVSDAALVYAADFVGEDRLPTAGLLGQHSASLVQTFVGGEAATAGVTSGSRTTTAGTTITVGGGHYRSSTPPTSVAVTDSKSNSYTDVELANTEVRVTLGYNVAGTRGTTHTVTSTASGGSGDSASTVSGHEWDGIEVTPTIVTNTATSTGTAVAVSRAVGAASLAVGIVAYQGASTTMAVASGTVEAYEQDENSDFQAQNVGYKVAQTGTPQLDWTLGASRLWLSVIICFTEAAAGGFVPFPRPRGLDGGLDSLTGGMA